MRRRDLIPFGQVARRPDPPGPGLLKPATRVLLTGASGFIGAHLTRLVVERGCLVTAVVRPGSSPERLRDVADRVTLVEGDVEDAGFCRGLVGRLAPEVVFHLGWYTRPGDCLDSPRNLGCLSGSLALLKGVAGTGCRRVVVAGSSVEYDTDLGQVSESSPVRPRCLYGACKASMFRAGEWLAGRHGWSFAHARIFNVYGPAEDERRLIPYVVRGLLRGEPCELTSGVQVRDYLHVEDVASALVTLADSEIQGAVNVASSRPVTIASLSRSVAHLIGRPDLLRFGSRPLRPGDYACLYAEPGLLQTRACWSPRYGLADGLRQTIHWWQNARPDPAEAPALYAAGLRKGA